ncbi:MAG: tyrosine-type recombinase/integrase [Steroidobacteraceae bacterium]
MLTDIVIRAAKPTEKLRKLFDEKGLYLVVMPSGGRLWRFKYRFPNGGPHRKEKLLALGPYPEVSLKEARVKRDEARRDLANGVDPAVKRKCAAASAADTFQAVALELFTLLRKASLAGGEPPATAAEIVERTISPRRKPRARKREPISAETIDTMNRRLEMHVFPYIGAYRVGAITAPQLLEILRRIESRGTFELAHRVRSICSRVLRYAKATGRDCEDVGADLIGLLTPVESENMAAIVDPIQIGGLLRAIEGYHGEPLTRLALRLVPYIFPRPIEFRTMEWSNVSLDGPTPEWRVPWSRMKMREPHVVPLARQAVAILGEIRLHTGHGRYAFPQLRKPHKPMSENCITAALRAMGYSGAEMTWHGFRALASTQLNSTSWGGMTSGSKCNSHTQIVTRSEKLTTTRSIYRSGVP